MQTKALFNEPGAHFWIGLRSVPTFILAQSEAVTGFAQENKGKLCNHVIFESPRAVGWAAGAGCHEELWRAYPEGALDVGPSRSSKLPIKVLIPLYYTIGMQAAGRGGELVTCTTASRAGYDRLVDWEFQGLGTRSFKTAVRTWSSATLPGSACVCHFWSFRAWRCQCVQLISDCFMRNAEAKKHALQLFAPVSSSLARHGRPLRTATTQPWRISWTRTSIFEGRSNT